MKRVRAIVVAGFGINCEQEMQAAYQKAGAQTDIIHLNDIFNERVSLSDYHIINFPGGFSFGDDLGSGKVMANKMKYKQTKNGDEFFKKLKKFVNRGKYILGICNGFQFLVKMGLLPNTMRDLHQEVTLTFNKSGKFEDRWCYLKVNKKTNTPFLKNISMIYLPIRHGEGRLIFANKKIRENIKKNNLNCMSYCNKNGKVTSKYPFNPNGSELNCAALTDKTGRIFGMMPHPEAFLSVYNHPAWTYLKRKNRNKEKGDGLRIFENIVKHVKKNYKGI
ncbi:MAG: phosphoribosylformylglycinamidine synthase subunit PurQ [Candidatus Cloacimonetes bacterium]|nr:phosphoribosylformylglycinamidine synthase subunit PurQ [Candidatus Cloacimonadota bacterium]